MRRDSGEHDEAMLRVAQLYYEHGLTQEEIANRLHLTRWKVGRLLDEAREVGIVRIEIVHPRARRHTEERELVEAFSLTDAVVVPTVDDEPDLRAALARAAADFLADLRPSPRVLGVSWGRTMDAVAAAIAPDWARGVHVVQINGSISRSQRRTSPVDVALRMAQRGPGTASILPAPTIVEKATTRRTLENEPSVRSVLDAARSADTLVFTVGAVTHESVLVESGYLSPEDIDRLRGLGACGDVLGRFIDERGVAVDQGMERRTIGLSLEELRGARRAIAVAAGASKHEAVLATVAARLCTSLVTDERTAHYLLEAV